MTEERDEHLRTEEQDRLPLAASRTENPEDSISEGREGILPTPRKDTEPTEPDTTKQLRGIEESLKGKDGTLHTVQFSYSVRSDLARIFQQMVAQGQYARDPFEGNPIPNGKLEYGTTGELFSRIKLAIAEQTNLSDQSSALTAFWILSTWFQDILPLAPGLALTGWAHSGDLILRTLRAFCYHPTLLAGITTAALNDVSWDRKPTLLISDPNLSKRMAVLLSSSTSRGYATFRTIAGRGAVPFDFFSSKAIFLGGDHRMVSALHHYLHIDTSPASRVESAQALPLSEKAIQDFQNQLLSYRIRGLPRVHTSTFRASGLSSEITSIANSVGRCIVDAPELQADLIELLTPFSDYQHAERIDELGALAIVAALALCHQGKEEVLVGEITAEVNRILKERGDRLRHSPEKVGRGLRKAGLLTRRLGAAGNGLVLDRATKALLHDVAVAYGCVGSSEPKEHLQCPLC